MGLPTPNVTPPCGLAFSIVTVEVITSNLNLEVSTRLIGSWKPGRYSSIRNCNIFRRGEGSRGRKGFILSIRVNRKLLLQVLREVGQIHLFVITHVKETTLAEVITQHV